MYNFRQHVPAIVDGVEPYIFPFEKIEELLSYEPITRFINPDFYKFSICHYPSYNGLGGSNTLMIESDEGRHWWCLGYFLDQNMQYITEKLDFLPEWSPPR